MFLLFLQQVVWVLFLLLASAFFSGSETALFSLSRAQRDSLGRARSSIGARVLWLLSDPRRLIATLILGNELVNIAITTLVTSLVVLSLQAIPGLSHKIASQSDLVKELIEGIGATFITIPLIVIVGELIPKTIAIKFSPTWSKVIAYPMTFVSWLFWVPRLILETIASAFVFLFTGRAKTGTESQQLQEKEFRNLVDLGNAEGEIASAERRMIHNVFDFGDLGVSQVMTPADKIFALPMDLPFVKLVEQVSLQHYARIPIYKGKLDNVVGVLLAKDLVGQSKETWGARFNDKLQPVFFIPKRATCQRLLREFQKRKMHLAIVVDEYGSVVGLVTMDDLLQTLLRGITGELQETLGAPQSTQKRVER